MMTDLASNDFAFTVTVNSAARSVQERARILANPGFGQYFSDHLVSIGWSRAEGWHDPRVQPYGPLYLDPAAAVLHYGQEVFEGLKAYRHEDNSLWTFRPDANARRLQRSACRLALPELPTELFVESLRQLIAVDAEWVPAEPEASLYLRPFMVATEAFLGVRAAEAVDYYLIASPAGPYFSDGVSPISIWLSTSYARAGKGGTGAAKTGGNYASSLLPQQEAASHGCAQVLFLDSQESRWIEELGGMNIVLVMKDGTLVTPDSDSILEGITRDSVLQLAEDRGHRVERRRISIEELRDAVASGDVAEVFACGTAAVITPIAEITGEGFSAGNEAAPAGELTLSLREELTGIQYGRREDKHGWMMRLDA
ncbi:branched-chain amino acid aminotransferase [Rathayibacter toxicus]|uniref:branched-chain amino acid aminotransferase n=1 Tax=Rathayibacter toxicus TaxID=145458 RepID=UPI001C050BB9|nr:branched-chain amino acid aminotransferase [Rathayibacter toxicus]QWL32683.1 branched-chain amino acid aminotransferase [Rathayibacter toxicus]QWL34778.1 branched-chain amino acid aminotransferase [Rathayibacter toxicus]QWL36909.1 branched-chain amino acid aminotransferase [Rathayibacter toxicus]QWL39001.1 branched-chain amino acid aminotransferase [Rathayibacter toxicus]QWL41087.1 branched-chain amino acid aminotransferase [Rathayibacter toxicus]